MPTTRSQHASLDGPLEQRPRLTLGTPTPPDPQQRASPANNTSAGAARTGTPTGAGSRATSTYPETYQSGFQMPDDAPVHGAASRAYLNKKVVPTLLEGFKDIVIAKPEAPLLWLSQYLLDQSKLLEPAAHSGSDAAK